MVTSIAALLLATSASALPVDDWPHWRGPARTNVSAETEWSSTGADEALWSADVGRGYSCPIVADGRVFAVGYRASKEEPNVGEDEVACYDAQTGDKRWSMRYASRAYANEHKGGVIGTPTVAGDVLLVASRQGELRALDVETGEARWELNLAERHGLDPGRYGFASSPYVDGERVVVCMSSAVAVDLESGKTLWVSDPMDACYSTVAAVTLPPHGDAEQGQLGYAAFGGEGLFVLNAENGKTLRRFEFRKSPRNVEGATPIVIGTDVFISSGYEQGGALVDVAADPPVERWRSRRMRTKLAGATFHASHFFGYDESMLTCIGSDGELRWRVRGLGQGALMIAGDRMLFMTSEGELVVAAASAEEYREISRRAVIDEGVFYAAPVLAGGLVYVRGSEGALVCLDHRGTREEAILAPLSRVRVPGEALSPEALEAGYLKSTGIAKLAAKGLSLRGELTVVALGLEDSASTWEVGPGGRWHTSFDLPPAMQGTIHEMFDGERGWTVDPYRGDKFLEDAKVSELRATHGNATLWDPLPEGLAASFAGRERFRGVPCHRVDVQLSKDVVRKVYFDVATGRYRGRTSENESTVVVGEWREVEGGALPFARTEFEPGSGLENRWTFEQATLGGLDDTLFELPESLRSDDEDEEDDGDDGDDGL